LNFDEHFLDGNADLLRPFGGNKYSSIDIVGEDEEDSLPLATSKSNLQVATPDSELPQESSDAHEIASVDDLDVEPSFEDELTNCMRAMEINTTFADKDNVEEDPDGQSSIETKTSVQHPPKGPGIHPGDYLWCERRWIHKQSVCRIVISPDFTPKSHDRLMHVCGFTAINKSSHAFDTACILHGN
jgi:hypothetical protein